MRGERHGIRETLVHLGRRGWKAGEDKDRQREKDEGQIVRSGFRTVRLGGARGARWGFAFLKLGVPTFPSRRRQKVRFVFTPNGLADFYGRASNVPIIPLAAQ
jgi:hypothetical protein